MNQIMFFLRKEFVSGIRTKKSIILLLIFLIIAIMSPFLAMILPDILELSFEEGIIANIPEPTSVDSWAQFYNNLGTIGLLVFIIINADIVCGEIEGRTLINLVTKGLSRKKIIIAKYLYLLIMWSILLLISFLICYLYTTFYFDDNLSYQLFETIGIYWLFGLIVISLLIFSSTISKNIYHSLILIVIFYIIGVLGAMFEGLIKYNPLTLSSKAMEFIANQSSVSDYYITIVITLILSLSLLLLSIFVFDKRKI